MSRKASNNFEEVISGHKMWSLEIQKLFFYFVRNRERYCHGILRDDRSIYCGVGLGLEHLGRHFWPSPVVKKEIEIFNVYHSNKSPLHTIKYVFKCPKQLIKPGVQVSTSGYFKKKFQILNVQCLKSSLLLICFT
jgi:hypothetical protein